MASKQPYIAYDRVVDGDQLARDRFPELQNISAGFLWKFIARPNVLVYPELVYVPMRGVPCLNEETNAQVTLTNWNAIWEAGPLRYNALHKRLPKEFLWLDRFKNQSVYLLPDYDAHKYEVISPLYHLLPAHLLKKFGLPAFRTGFWPPGQYDWAIRPLLPRDFQARVARAFGEYIWPFLSPGGKLGDFADSDPIVLLAHNLDFWLPYVYMVAEGTLRAFSRVPVEDEKTSCELARLKKQVPSDVLIDPPLRGGRIWTGEDSAHNATEFLLECADKYGQVRRIIDAVRSNRVQDDFSDRWSHAKVDFERKLHHTRSKIRVSFVEIGDSIPVHGYHSEVHDNFLWEDFFALLKPKERSIVVCLRNGETKLGDIARSLGYANHSPISKALARIRQKAKQYLERY